MWGSEMPRLAGARSIECGPEAGGQALVEFALLLPVFLFIVFGVVQLIFLLRADGAVHDVARQTARLAALAGSETAGVDQSARRLAILEGLDPRVLSVQITTVGGDGSAQPGPAHPLDVAAQAPAAPAAYNADIQVTLTYAYTLDFSLWGRQTYSITANAAATSAAFGGQQP